MSTENRGELIVYRTEDGQTEVQLHAQDGSVWLNQGELAELFDTSKQNISLHIKNILEEGELLLESVVKEYLTTAEDGKNYKTKHYSLHMILAVGYRVRSPRGTQFRQWATAHLAEYLVKGFVMDDERLKNPGGWDYFDELLALFSFSLVLSRHSGSSVRYFCLSIHHFCRQMRPYNFSHCQSRSSIRHSRESGNPSRQQADETASSLHSCQQAQRNPLHWSDQRSYQTSLGTQKSSGRRIYQKIPRSPVSVFRATSGYVLSHNQGKTAQEVESRLENSVDRKGESRLARFMEGYLPVIAHYSIHHSRSSICQSRSSICHPCSSICHSRAGGNPCAFSKFWIPACAGMTEGGRP